MQEFILKYKDKCFPLLDQAIVSGGNFVVGILLARTLGLEGYGEYALAWLVVLFCSSIHHAWIISPMYTFYPQLSGAKNASYFSALLAHQLLFSTVASAATWILLKIAGKQLLGWEIDALIPWVSISVFTYLMYDFFRRSFYATNKVTKVIFLDALVYGSQFLGVLILSNQSLLNVSTVFMLITISYSLSFFFGVSSFKLFKIEKEAIIELTKSHWSFSKWLLATSLLQWMSGNFFILAAASILSPLAVGTIRIMQNIIGLLHVLFLAIENYVPIRASKIFQADGKKALGHFLRQITWKGGLVTLFLAGSIALFGEEIIELLYQGKYTDQAYLLYGFAVLYILVFIGTNYRFAIRTLEQTKSIFIAYLWSAGFSLLFANGIITTFGIEGIIIGLIGTQLIMQFYFIYSLRTKINLFWK